MRKEFRLNLSSDFYEMIKWETESLDVSQDSKYQMSNIIFSEHVYLPIVFSWEIDINFVACVNLHSLKKFQQQLIYVEK